MLETVLSYIDCNGLNKTALINEPEDAIYIINETSGTFYQTNQLWDIDALLDDIDIKEFENCSIKKCFLENIEQYFKREDMEDYTFDIDRFKREVNVI